nr:HPr family phosphocarrier protein [uncultured Agathobaculum sp.]
MKQFEYVITDPVGIHARPAGLLVKEAKQHASRIMLQKGEKAADATRMMSVMGLGVKCGDTLNVTVEGEDEEAAAAAIQAFFAENL